MGLIQGQLTRFYKGLEIRVLARVGVRVREGVQVQVHRGLFHFHRLIRKIIMVEGIISNNSSSSINRNLNRIA